ncbi:MAG: hypothetical protein IMW96_10125 [Thermoanaerobacteraceae bacterium]|uniref:hypothetical protein n=1 Tax=Thermanaeromonas sp. C210 TaxID=2731925 RepID=UPI00155D2995|nr:hypothetical protein [Thermanaeromonas sp. C210]MBE3581967.1 hypothetical protein [Thermoanaerobacteraceae bacterium]GFN22136.1 hypothetical protein TAMC210_04520 [Thermanaeromonas sp. C210]
MKKNIICWLLLTALSLFLLSCGSNLKNISVQSGPTDPNYRGVIYEDKLGGSDSGKPNI